MNETAPDSRAIPVKLAAGVALALLAVVALVVSPIGVLVLMLALCMIATAEWYRIARISGAKPMPVVGFAAVAAIFALAYGRPDEMIANLPSIVAAAAAAAFVLALARRKLAGATIGIAVTVAGAIYAGALGAFVVVMRRAPGGFRIVLTFGLMVALNDAFSFLAGTAIGGRVVRRPFAPAISPGKTWEGWFAGTAATFAVAGIAAWQMNPPFTLGRSLVLAALVSVMAPLGDLAESTVKRDLGLKDTAHLLPGHGGVLDRLDSVLFCAPAFYFALRALLG